MKLDKLIKDKKICEIHLDNNTDTFDVGILFHENEESGFAKCFGKNGEFAHILMFPRDYIYTLAYDTKYIAELGIQDIDIDSELSCCDWKSKEEVFAFLKNQNEFIAIDDYNDDEIAGGIIIDFDDDSITLQSYDCENKNVDGFTIVNVSGYFCLRWGGKTKCVAKDGNN